MNMSKHYPTTPPLSGPLLPRTTTDVSQCSCSSRVSY